MGSVGCTLMLTQISFHVWCMYDLYLCFMPVMIDLCGVVNELSYPLVQ